MARPNGISVLAGGTIVPCTFVKLDTAAPEQVVAASANSDQIFGVAQEGQNRAPGLPGSDAAIAAITGDQVRVFQPGEDCLLTLGGTVTQGDRLTSDAAGKGVAGTTGQFYGARALQSGVSGQKIRVVVDRGIA